MKSDLTAKHSDVRRDYYVYHLIDPRCGSVFYVGKGCGRRVMHHEYEARNPTADSNHRKISRIQSIWASGHQVVRQIVQRGMSEPQAYELEDLHIRTKENLTNGTSAGVSKNRRHAQYLYQRLRPFHIWVKSNPYPDFVDKQEGGAKGFYDRFKRELEILAYF